MQTKKERLSIICDLVTNHSPGNQEVLLSLLHKKGFYVTQATLSRDIKQLKIIKSTDTEGHYIYTVPPENIYLKGKPEKTESELAVRGFISLEFSGQLAVIKTRPGYAMGIASDIDNKASVAILGTIAGDDTILLIPREGIGKEEVTAGLSALLGF
jgi:transcriptional regulator of arginine metabolism